MRHFSRAEQTYTQALGMFPADAVRELADIHNQLGIIDGEAGRIDVALHHYRESIRYRESRQDCFRAGLTRNNAGRALASAGRFTDARDWAQSALRDYQACENAEQEVVDTLKLLEWIESGRQANSPQP